MRRVVRILCAALAVLGSAVVTAPQPAGALADGCAVYGLMEVFGRLGQYGLHHDQNLGYKLVMYDPGGCIASDQLVITGRIQGTCMAATISGSSEQGHSFTGRWDGPQWTLTGKLTGTLTVAELPLYPLCISGAAWGFGAHGVLTETHLT